MNSVSQIKRQIQKHSQNVEMKKLGYEPIFTAHPNAKVIIIGQAPGIRAQESKKPWDDKSGEQLRRWLGVTDEDFYNPEKISLMPMDFYFTGHGKAGVGPVASGVGGVGVAAVEHHLQGRLLLLGAGVACKLDDHVAVELVRVVLLVAAAAVLVGLCFACPRESGLACYGVSCCGAAATRRTCCKKCTSRFADAAGRGESW